jgi:hypothetical protein
MTTQPSSTALRSADCAVIELRQYTLHPGQRDVLIDIFDREFVETQEAVGMKVAGQFRDLDDADRFVWLRGFANMGMRREGLQSFYGGPAWAAHGPAANATMVEWRDVLLLRPAWKGSAIALEQPRPAPGTAGHARGLLDATIFPLREPATPRLVHLARGAMSGVLRAGGARMLAWYVTEPTANDFPRLPVREGEQVLLGLALFDDAAAFDAFAASGRWSREVAPLLQEFLAGPLQARRLAPTARSALRG